MSRIRLSRAENREQTRRRLIAAAATIIAKKGLAATSVENIATKAGFTRGAFYSNFGSKNDLFLELLRVEHRLTQERLRNLIDTAEPSESFQTQLVTLYTQCYRDNSNHILWTEAHLHAMRDAKFRKHIKFLCLEKRDMIARIAEALCTRFGVQLPHAFVDHALAMITLIDGIHHCNMTMPNEFASTLIEALLRLDRIDDSIKHARKARFGDLSNS